MTLLRIGAVAEALTLAVLLVNLVTVHAETITSLVGPLHGAAYVLVICAAAPGARMLACIPVVGGLLALHKAV
ncbi:DUF3817 domain-containing protein [Nonomuraea sp. NPDC048826]|uniref:DUF3817 domain-containing protein n=1 Tax=Nonomuraea sp. NPDC048826 TaxID=3364347 RepID=UPI00371F4BDC